MIYFWHAAVVIFGFDIDVVCIGLRCDQSPVFVVSLFYISVEVWSFRMEKNQG